MRNKLFDSLTDERGGENDASAIARYSFALPYIKNKTILDIGCGLGLGSELQAKSHAKKVVAIDYSNTAINYAKKNHFHKNIKYIPLDAQDINTLNEKFDVITSFELLEHLSKSEQKSFLKNIANLLHKKGMCIMSTPNRLVYSKGNMKSSNPFHKFEYTHNELKTFCKKYFDYVQIKGIIIKNKQHYKYKKDFKTTLNSKIIDFVCKYRFTHKLLGVIPKQFKNLVTQSNKAPVVTVKDYTLTNTKLNQADSFFIICKKE